MLLYFILLKKLEGSADSGLSALITGICNRDHLILENSLTILQPSSIIWCEH